MMRNNLEHDWKVKLTCMAVASASCHLSGCFRVSISLRRLSTVDTRLSDTWTKQLTFGDGKTALLVVTVLLLIYKASTNSVRYVEARCCDAYTEKACIR